MPARVADAGHKEATTHMLLKPNTHSAALTANNGDGASAAMLEDESQPVLETRSQRQARRRSHYVVYLTTFVMSIGFSIVLTGVWPYLQQLDGGVSKEYLGWVIAANPLGQMLASPLLGFWANRAKSNRGSFLLTLSLFTIGNGFYAILSVFGSAALTVMILSRFLVGISSANIALVRSYISSSTTTMERTTAVALTSAAQGLGFIIGPAIQTALAVAFAHNTANYNNSTLLGEGTAEQVATDEVRIELNMYSATGWIGVFLGITNFFLFFPCVYQEHPIAAREAMLQKRLSRDENKKIPKPDYVCLIGVLFSFFIFLFIYVLLETIIVPMCIDLYAWSDEKAITIVGIGLSLAGALSIVMYALTSVLTRRFDERKVFIFLGLVPMTIAMLIHFPIGNTYPKMRNCTIESLPNEEFDSPSTLVPDLLSLTSLPEHNMTEKQSLRLLAEGLGLTNLTPSTLSLEKININKEVELSTSISEKMNTTKETEALMSTTGDEMKLSTGQHLNTNGSEDILLSRKHRYVTREATCSDLGCPTEQEWCLYTPIIEMPQLAVGAFIAVIGYPVAFSLSSSLFSKILGPKPQGVWMGILTSTGSLSRVVGPVCVSYLYTVMGTRWTFGVLVLLMGLTIVEICCLYQRLIPMQIARAKS